MCHLVGLHVGKCPVQKHIPQTWLGPWSVPHHITGWASAMWPCSQEQQCYMVSDPEICSHIHSSLRRLMGLLITRSSLAIMLSTLHIPIEKVWLLSITVKGGAGENKFHLLFFCCNHLFETGQQPRCVWITFFSKKWQIGKTLSAIHTTKPEIQSSSIPKIHLFKIRPHNFLSFSQH